MRPLLLTLAYATLAFGFAPSAHAQDLARLPPLVPGQALKIGAPLAETCPALPISDACTILTEAARMLGPSYTKRKTPDGEAAFARLGYKAKYIAAKRGIFPDRTDVFLVSKPGTNRLFVVLTGTESTRDWYENAKYRPDTARYADGQFYVPPGHAGFRSGMLNITQDVLKLREFDTRPLDCSDATRPRSALARFICDAGLPTGRQSIETVIVGHSRGAGIGIVTASAFAGLAIKRPNPDGPISVDYQTYWPLRIHAVIGFAPPYSIYGRSDADAGMTVPAGYENQWLLLQRFGILDRTILFINDRDIVPSLSLGYGRHFGYRYRIGRDGHAVYDGFDGFDLMTQGKDFSLFDAHSAGGYCRSVVEVLLAGGACD